MEGKDKDKDDLMTTVDQSWDRLSNLWKQYGHRDELLDKRKKTVYRHCQELFADMICEEERRIEEKKVEIVRLRTELDGLTADHELPIFELKASSLLEEQAALARKIDELRKLKAKKMEHWNALRQDEVRLCEEMGEALSEEPKGIPKEQEVTRLRALISKLDTEKKRRHAEYLKLKDKVSESLAQVEKVPTSAIERTLLRPAVPVLTLDFLREAGQLETDLAAQVQENEANTAALWNKIKELWTRLEVEQEVQKLFEDRNAGSKPSVIEQLRSELSRLEALKIANLATFIARLRQDITTLSAQVFKVTDLPEEVISEDGLDEHERVLDELKTYSENNRKIIELFNKRNTMWNQWKECEIRAEDPNRLNNRGGGLLREEKTRRALEKNLPKVEKEIEDLSNGRFHVFGVDVMEFMKREWDERNRDKEDRKAEKKKKTAGGVGEKTVMMNMTRKRPATPAGGVGYTPGGGGTGKRNRLMPVNKVVGTTPAGVRGPRTGGLKDHLVSPARTYTDFTNHNQIFQSTLNNGVGPAEGPTPVPTPIKAPPTPSKSSVLRKPQPNKKLFMTPTMHL